VSIFGDVVLLLGIMAVLFWMDWRLALVTFAVLPLLLALTFWFKTGARRAFREVRVKIARINAFLQEHLSGMTVVQLFAGEEAALRSFQRVNRDHRDANVRAILYYAVYFPAVELLTALGVALILWYGGGQVIKGAVSVGALVAFLQYSQRFYQPLADLSEKYNILQGAMASSERIFELLDTPASWPGPDSEGGHAETMKGAVELQRVSFSYRPGTPVLDDLSFIIEPGERVALVGHTGAGKSTVASLLLRFYEPGTGSILVDGVDLGRWDLRELRRQVALVLQDVFLFAGDVAGNVALGRDEVTRERILWALSELGCEALVDRLDEPLKERGAGLSVGEKQLLAFARALAADPRILVLDEATSSVDPESERLVQRALDRLLQGRTALIIAHRLSTIRSADRILVLHRGRLREEGRHEDLLAQGGIYEKLYRIQLNAQEGYAGRSIGESAAPAPPEPGEAPPLAPSSPPRQGSDRKE
jgi:ATP-binding cassette subfamily B protein